MSFAVLIKNRPIVEFHHMGEKPTTTFIDEVIWFQADGDELTMIRNRFENIPITKGNFCIWSGELAQFIFRNLTL